MKKLCLMFVISALVFATGCDNQSNKQNEEPVVDEAFIVNSIKWGSSWESVEDYPELSDCKIITDDGNRVVVEIDDYEYLNQKGKLRMLFADSEASFPSTGFIQAYFGYDEAVEKAIVEEGERIYGERKDFFSDEQGVENPLSPSAWYSEATLEKTLNEKEKEEYLKKYEGKGYDETQMKALLRVPLVVITVDEENNIIRFQGNGAAVTENLGK